MTDASPQELQQSMQRMEDELERLLNEWSNVAEQLIRLDSQVERLKAPRRLVLKHGSAGKPTVEDLNAQLFDWLWTEHEDLMRGQLEAEARNAALETKYKVATKALSSKQTRLKADTAMAAGPTRR